VKLERMRSRASVTVSILKRRDYTPNPKIVIRPLA
jgi:hypothetical protein